MESSTEILILDGGLATELEQRGHDISGPLWSARLLLDAPGAIEQLHYDYFAAGAHYVISASYQASYEGFAKLELTAEETTFLLQRSVALAQSARNRCEEDDRRESSAGVTANGRKRYVAASVGPYGATRHDGSEYHGNYGLSVGDLRAFHAARFDVLAKSGADRCRGERHRGGRELRSPTRCATSHQGAVSRNGQADCRLPQFGRAVGCELRSVARQTQWLPPSRSCARMG